MEERVVLVDENDNETGTEEKLKVHVEKKLHRSISILIFNIKGEMLLQQRSVLKYHCPLLWSNACCTHPRLGEPVIEASHRRLKEEMGFDCDLEEVEDLRHLLFKCPFYLNEREDFLSSVNKQGEVTSKDVKAFICENELCKKTAFYAIRLLKKRARIV